MLIITVNDMKINETTNFSYTNHNLINKKYQV